MNSGFFNDLKFANEVLNVVDEIVLVLGFEGRIIHCNKALESLKGYI